MLFQRKHSIYSNYFVLEKNLEYSNCSSNVHRSFEIFCQVEGKTGATIDGKSYTLNPGEAVLIFPFQVHSFTRIEDGNCWYCIFSPDMVEDFFVSYKGMLPIDNKFKYVLPDNVSDDNIYIARSAAYHICGEFELQTKRKLRAVDADDNILISLFLYVDNNYCGECSLAGASKQLGYDYSYVSKQFKAKVGMPFNRYVNLLRIRKSQHLIKSSEMSFSEIMQKCGFSSLRSFDRNFKSVVGMSPSEYKKCEIDKQDIDKQAD